jgi:LacI family transcriptional regulator
MDDAGSAQLATRHLAGWGHRRIALIAGPGDYLLSGWRIDGWRAAMADAGLPTEDLLDEGDFSHASGYAAARRLLSQPRRPSAIIASNDQMAHGTLDCARDMGLEVPRDLSVISTTTRRWPISCAPR